MITWEIEWCESCYLVLFQSIGQMFCSFQTDFIPREIYRGEYLLKAVNKWLTGKQNGMGRITLFRFRALARCRAP